MNDATNVAVSEHRLPAAYSHGYAHVRVVPIFDVDSPGPLEVMPQHAAKPVLAEGVPLAAVPVCSKTTPDC